MILDKKQMSEEDIKLQYITPAITARWDIRKITMETQITDGRVSLTGNFVYREKPKRADYLLYLNANNPIAVVEAKDNNHSISSTSYFGDPVYSYSLKELQSAGSAGEFYTPRAVTEFMARMIDPQIGEQMAEIPLPKLIRNRAA